MDPSIREKPSELQITSAPTTPTGGIVGLFLGKEVSLTLELKEDDASMQGASIKVTTQVAAKILADQDLGKFQDAISKGEYILLTAGEKNQTQYLVKVDRLSKGFAELCNAQAKTGTGRFHKGISHDGLEIFLKEHTSKENPTIDKTGREKLLQKAVHFDYENYCLELQTLSLTEKEATDILEHLKSFKASSSYKLGKEYHIRKSDVTPPLKCSINIAKDGSVFILLKQRTGINPAYQMLAQGSSKTVQTVFAIKQDGTTDVMAIATINVSLEAKLKVAKEKNREAQLKKLPPEFNEENEKEWIPVGKDLERVQLEQKKIEEKLNLEFQRLERFTGLIDTNHITSYASSKHKAPGLEPRTADKLVNVPMKLCKDMTTQYIFHKIKASPGHTQVFIKQLLDQLYAIHHDKAEGENGLLHRDIKPGNTVRDEEGNYWIVDFGLTLKSEQLSEETYCTGTHQYFPLALLNQVSDGYGNYSYKNYSSPDLARIGDVYALGLTILESMGHKDVANWARQGVNNDFLKESLNRGGISPELADFIFLMLCQKPWQAMTIETLIDKFMEMPLKDFRNTRGD